MKFFKSLIYLVVFVISAQTTFSQETINQLNNKGQRTGVWKKYFSNKRIRYEGKFEDGKEVGVFKYYSALSSNHPTIIKTFNKISSIADVNYYSENGILMSEGQMNEKNRIGKWLYYYPEGKSLMVEENYINGLLDGVFKSYYKNGKITEILNYKSGLLHGNSKRYADNGTLLDDLNYKEGKRQGLAAFYNLEGELILKGTYENDHKTDDWIYYQNGKQVKNNVHRQ